MAKRNSEHFLELIDDAEVLLNLVERRDGVWLNSHTSCSKAPLSVAFTF